MVQKIKRSNALGENIKNLRLKTGFGVKELADYLQLLGCDITTRESLNKIEAGNQNITLLQLKGFISAFNITYDEFFKFLEEE